jgi:PAS domain S-box-containing protein
VLSLITQQNIIVCHTKKQSRRINSETIKFGLGHLLNPSAKEPAMNSALELFANAGDAVFAIDQDQRIMFWNTHATQTLGYSTHQVIGQPCWKLLDGKTISGTQICRANCPIFQKIIEGIPVEPFNLLVKTHTGEHIKMNMSSIGLPNNGEGISGLVHIQRKV